jgi:hypothetical protein
MGKNHSPLNILGTDVVRAIRRQSSQPGEIRVEPGARQLQGSPTADITKTGFLKSKKVD